MHRWGILIALIIVGCGTRTALDRGHPRPPRPDASQPLPPPPPPPMLDAGPPDSGRPPDSGPPCVPQRTVLPAGQVDVVFVIDHSTSMGWPIGEDGDPRWSLLLTAMSEELSRLDPRVRSGAFYFPSGPFCSLEEELDVPLARDNMPAILESLERGVIDGRTPVLEACSNVFTALIEDATEDRNRFVVLLSDGDDYGTCARTMPTISVLDARMRLGIETFVVIIGGYPGALHELAVDGGRSVDDMGYEAADLPSLRAILRQIADTLGNCVFDVPLMLTESSRVTVRVGGEVVPYDVFRADGTWSWSGEGRSSISLFGEACRRRIARNAVVEAIVSCEPRDGG